MLIANCATGTIDPYIPSANMPWNRQRVIHLFRRLGFGASPQEVDAALNQDPLDLIDQIIDNSPALNPIPEPEWAYWNLDQYTDFTAQSETQIIEWGILWLRDMLDNGLRGKLALFWHNHFVTKSEEYQCPSYLFQYYRLPETYALGNFKDFIHDMGITPAMLLFLNGFQNTKFDPNENYARELYELFSLGVDNNYTQEDIEETSRALTGWNNFTSGLCGAIEFLPATFDDGVKTIFGQTGNWGYDDVINILFDQRSDEIAAFICEKLYKFFVSPEVAEDIITEMATTFKDSNFNIEPVLRQLFKSEHFFDEANMNVVIKSPLHLELSLLKELNLPYDNDDRLSEVLIFSFLLGQQLFSPVNVAGWPENRSWLDTDRLTGRWQAITFQVFTVFEQQPELLTAFAVTLAGSPAVTDPAFVTQVIVDQLLPAGFQTLDEYDQATTVFKADIPENYYNQGLWNLDWETVPYQVLLLMLHLVRQPEWQMT